MYAFFKIYKVLPIDTLTFFQEICHLNCYPIGKVVVRVPLQKLQNKHVNL